jgi:serine/threonine protein kinase
MISEVRREVNCMAMLNHENIIKLFGVSTNKVVTKGDEKLCLVLEYAENGSLEHLMFSKLKHTLFTGRPLYPFGQSLQNGRSVCKFRLFWFSFLRKIALLYQKLVLPFDIYMIYPFITGDY